MPKMIAQVHDTMVLKFLNHNSKVQGFKALPRVWLKKENQSIIPCSIDI